MTASSATTRFQAQLARWPRPVSRRRHDTQDTDLSGFAVKGGKLLMLTGMADMLISTRETERYVAGIRSILGAAKADACLRYYEIPAYQHFSSTVFDAAWDSLTAFEIWVEKGVDPA